MEAPVVGYMMRTFPQFSETFIANEILALERRGVQIQIYSYRKPRAVVPHASVGLIQAPVTYLPDPLLAHPVALLHANYALYRLEPQRYRRTLRYALALAIRERTSHTWRRFLQAVYLAYLLRRSEVQHLHAHFAHSPALVAMLASMLTGMPYSFTAHARDIFSVDVDFRLLCDKVQQAQWVVTESQYNKAFLRSKIGPIADSRVHVLNNGIDLEKFSPDPAVQREEGFILGVGRLVEKKGFSCLLKACQILRDQGRHVRCELVGNGDLRQRLEQEVCQLGLEHIVRLVGPRSQEELPPYYRRAAVLVHPSVVAADQNQDALPTVLLEGMACGAPVVASRLAGIPEIVDHEENGFLVGPGDPVALARAIELLLYNPQLRERFGAAGRAKAERCFDMQENVKVLHRLFNQSVEVQQLVER